MEKCLHDPKKPIKPDKHPTDKSFDPLRTPRFNEGMLLKPGSIGSLRKLENILKDPGPETILYAIPTRTLLPFRRP